LQISASVQPAPPVSIVEFDEEVSCLTNPSSGICIVSNDESNEESNNTNNEDISGG
jgi:hypothetical protein